MQQRSREERDSSQTPSGDTVFVPPDFWEELKRKDLAALCRVSGAQMDAAGGIVLHFLNENIRVDIDSKCLQRRENNTWERIADPLPALISLVYLLNVTTDEICAEMVSVKDLKCAHFFQGPHTLKTEPLIAKFGRDPRAFKEAGRTLEGNDLDMADAAFCLKPFLKIPVYYLLWAGDDEFPPSLSVLFDRSIEGHLPADAIWGLVSLLTDRLMQVTPIIATLG